MEKSPLACTCGTLAQRIPVPQTKQVEVGVILTTKIPSSHRLTRRASAQSTRYRNEEDVEGLSERRVLPSVDHYECNHAELYEQQNGPGPRFETCPYGPLVVAAVPVVVSVVGHRSGAEGLRVNH